MSTIGISKAKATFSRLVSMLEDGKLSEMVITRGGKPVAKLVPLAAVAGKRLGIPQGAFQMPDDFDAHDAEIARLFNGGNAP